MPIVLLTKRWGHHSASSGYDRLSRELDALTIGRPETQSFFNRLERAFWNRTTHERKYLSDYRFEDFQVERKAVSFAKAGNADLIHVLYGDEQLDLLLLKRNELLCPLVATFHLPPDRVAVRCEMQGEMLKRLDAAVVVAHCQARILEDCIGVEKVIYIPHGIDITAFSPPLSRVISKRLRLLVVGQHLRDFDLIRRVADRCSAQGLGVDFDVVASSESQHYFSGCTNIDFQHSISEKELVALYSSADALFLPVIDATANNAVLESLACGTPVITTAVGGMPDYVDDSSGFLLTSATMDEAFELIRSLSDRRHILNSMRAGARKRAEAFSWENVTRQLSAVYARLIADRHQCNSTK